MIEASRIRLSRPLSAQLPPQAFFVVSAVFHYLGPAFAVLLFPHVGVLGVAWLRIASAAAIFAPWTRPWRTLAAADRRQRLLLLAFGACLAAMNCCFYLALARLPISLVAAIEFVGTIGVALYGLRSPRNLTALGAAVAGTLILIDVEWAANPAGLAFAMANGGLFVGYVVLGHRLAASGAADGIARLGAAMAIAFVLVLPVGIGEALTAFGSPLLLGAAVGVGICSSVIPYVCDQLAMARLSRASFALMLCLLPVTATLIGALVLAQIPSPTDLAGIALVVAGVALHRPPADASSGTPQLSRACP
ncbi:MAG: EamA family transporter [Mesorhizobium sp.]